MLTRVIPAILFAWVFLIEAMGFTYTWLLLHPPCPAWVTPPLGAQVVTLSTPGADFRGWWVPSRNGAVVILLAGYASGPSSMTPEMELLAGKGYGVLVPESRPCGGRKVSLGYLEVDDLHAAVRFIIT